MVGKTLLMVGLTDDKLFSVKKPALKNRYDCRHVIIASKLTQLEGTLIPVDNKDDLCSSLPVSSSLSPELQTKIDSLS